MFANKISSVVVTSTDNILISKFVSTITLGLYSNYTIFVSMLRNIVTKLFEAISGSIGNLAATEGEHKTYSTYKNIWFGNYWLISFCIVMLFSFINKTAESIANSNAILLCFLNKTFNSSLECILFSLNENTRFKTFLTAKSSSFSVNVLFLIAFFSE